MNDNGKNKFVLPANENEGTGFYGKWAYYAKKKREWLEEQKKKEQEKKE